MAKKEEAKAPAADADGKPAGKSKLKLIILIVVGLLLAIGLSVGATLFFLKGDKKEEAKSEEHAKTVLVSCTLAQPAVRTEGEGSSRRAAEQVAAEAALEQVESLRR